MKRGRGSVTQSPSGGWMLVADVGVEGGPRKQVRRRGFATKREAVAALEEITGSVRAGRFVEPSKLTVQDYFTDWLASREVAGLRRKTLSSYRSNLELHVFPTLGSAKLQSVGALDLDRLYSHLRRSGRTDGAGGLAPRTVRYVHTIVRAGLDDAVRKGLVVLNVADAASPPSAKAAKAPEMSFWTPGELSRFLTGAAEETYFPCFRLAAMTGARRGEVVGARWEDIDLVAGRWHVRRQALIIDGRLVAEEMTKSDHSRRIVDLDEATVAILAEHKANQRSWREQVGAGWQDTDGLAFTDLSGAPLDPGSVGKRFGRVSARLGLPTIRFHDLRHTHATHLIASGADLLAVAKRLGHGSVQFCLDRYGHLLPGRQAEAARAVAAMVSEADEHLAEVTPIRSVTNL